MLYMHIYIYIYIDTQKYLHIYLYKQLCMCVGVTMPPSHVLSFGRETAVEKRAREDINSLSSRRDHCQDNRHRFIFVLVISLFCRGGK